MNRYAYLLILLLALLTTGTASAQSDEQARLLEQADADYKIGQFEQVQSILKQHIGTLKGTDRLRALRLLALSFLAQDDNEQTEYYARQLVELNRYYSNVDDPARFQELIEQIKAGQNTTITTASSMSENINEVPVPTTLITEDMIRNSGARNLQELLAIYVPSMNIIDCNDDVNISMRGIYSNSQEKILILLNGHRLNSYCTNIAAPDFSISLEKLKQIEVLRGPASSLYGGVALTAVVNLITKQGADVDGVILRAGIGNYGQYRGDVVFGKRYFDLDILLWGGFNLVKGEKSFITKEETGLGPLYGKDGDVTVGGIGPKPSYDIGTSIKYKDLQFLFNIQYSQIQAPMTMTYIFTPYDIAKYRTHYGIRPSYSTMSHHADLSYSKQFGNIYLKGTVTYDNSDLTHYQVITDDAIPGFTDMLPLPAESKATLPKGKIEGLSRYITGQEHTFGGKLQGDWNYINNDTHKGLLSLGVEYSYFQLDDARYVFGYNFTKTLPETVPIHELGKGHENNANAYLQLKHHWGPVIFNAGLRFDYKSRYDSTHIHEFSPRVALIYVKPKWNVKLSYSKSYIDAPYLYRKSNLFLAAFAKLTNLTEMIEPEKLNSYQVSFGATQWIKGLDFEINAFYNRASNLIEMELLEHYNGGSSDLYGIELTANYEHRRFQAHLAASWQKAKDIKHLYQEMPWALNTPEFSANTVLAYKATKNLTLHTRLGFYSQQHTSHIDILKYVRFRKVYTELYTFSQQFNSAQDMTAEDMQQYELLRQAYAEAQDVNVQRDIKPYFLVDLGANYNIGKLQLSLNINNLLNHKYSLSGACTGLIPQKGRWWMFDIAYKF